MDDGGLLLGYHQENPILEHIVNLREFTNNLLVLLVVFLQFIKAILISPPLFFLTIHFDQWLGLYSWTTLYRSTSIPYCRTGAKNRYLKTVCGCLFFYNGTLHLRAACVPGRIAGRHIRGISARCYFRDHPNTRRRSKARTKYNFNLERVMRLPVVL